MPKEDLLVLHERENIRQIFSYLREIFLAEFSEEAFETIYDFWDTKVSGFLWNNGLYSDYLECGKIVLDCSKRSQNLEIKTQLLGEVGYAYMERGNYAVAESCFQEALENYTRLKRDDKQCKSIRYLATLSLKQNKSSKAKDYISLALNIIKKQKNIEDFAWKLNQSEFYSLLGDVEIISKNFNAAHLNFALAFRAAKQLSDKAEYYQAGHLRSLGKCFLLRKNYSKAFSMYNFCLAKSRGMNRLDLIIAASIDLAELLIETGERHAARKHLEEAIKFSGNDHPLLLEKATILLNDLTRFIM